jgi:hypothetical protein
VRSTHHEFGGSHQAIATASDRSFGLVFGAAFALITAAQFHRGGNWWPVTLGLSAVFLLIAFLRPALLAPLNRVWTKVGLLMGAVVAPIVMGVVYFGLITPMAQIARAFGVDFLRLRGDPKAVSYWLPRLDEDQTQDRLRDQF